MSKKKKHLELYESISDTKDFAKLYHKYKLVEDIKICESQLDLLVKQRDQFNKSISILEGQLKVLKIKNCKGKLVYESDLRDDYVYKCNKCDNMHIFSILPKSLKCKDNV